MNARAALACALLALCALYLAWFLGEGDPFAAAVFALPPLLLAGLLRWRARGATFWSGVLALAWFSHGVMVAWSRPPERGFALAAVALALAVVLAGNLPALRQRFGRRPRS